MHSLSHLQHPKICSSMNTCVATSSVTVTPTLTNIHSNVNCRCNKISDTPMRCNGMPREITNPIITTPYGLRSRCHKKSKHSLHHIREPRTKYLHIKTDLVPITMTSAKNNRIECPHKSLKILASSTWIRVQ